MWSAKLLSIESIGKTSDNRVAASIRWLLGILFLMKGVMKLVVPISGKESHCRLIVLAPVGHMTQSRPLPKYNSWAQRMRR